MPAKKNTEAAVEKKELSFEESLARLTRIAEILENETPSLEQALSLYEESAALLKNSSQKLKDAEAKITLLTKDA